MASVEFSDWYTQQVSVKPKTGGAGFGDVDADPVPVPCYVEEAIQVVTDAAGREITSTATVFAPLDKADLFPLDSEVTLPSGRVAQVIVVALCDSGGLDDLDLDHIEVSLT